MDAKEIVRALVSTAAVAMLISALPAGAQTKKIENATGYSFTSVTRIFELNDYRKQQLVQQIHNSPAYKDIESCEKSLSQMKSIIPSGTLEQVKPAVATIGTHVKDVYVDTKYTTCLPTLGGM